MKRAKNRKVIHKTNIVRGVELRVVSLIHWASIRLDGFTSAGKSSNFARKLFLQSSIKARFKSSIWTIELYFHDEQVSHVWMRMMLNECKLSFSIKILRQKLFLFSIFDCCFTFSSLVLSNEYYPMEAQCRQLFMFSHIKTFAFNSAAYRSFEPVVSLFHVFLFFLAHTAKFLDTWRKQHR